MHYTIITKLIEVCLLDMADKQRWSEKKAGQKCDWLCYSALNSGGFHIIEPDPSS